MSRPYLSVAGAPIGAAASPRLHPAEQTRNLLHLLMVLSLWLSTVTPLLTQPQLALANALTGWIGLRAP